MTYSKQFSKQIPSEQIVDEIKRAITAIYALSVNEYNSNLFHDVAVGFKSIVYNMEKDIPSAFPLFLKWLKLYVRLQHQIDPKDKNLLSKFEKRIPVCTSYIVASLQYQTKIANYHLQAMEMCLSIFNSTSTDIMKMIANLEIEIIALFWMPIEFVGDYNTQKLSLKLIVKVLKYLNESERRKKVAEIGRGQDVQNLLLKLTVDDANFEKISRELLNTFNMRTTKTCAVFSVYCTTVLFGSFELFEPENVDKFWIDFNYTSKSVSFLCELNKNSSDRKPLSIQIKIDKLQIDNQFDCIVLSIEPAIFSTEVTTELNNARIAVFTLPENEMHRLKANRDLLDFYNKSYDYSYSESDVPPTPNTIENYLAEDEYRETLNLQESHILSPVVMLPKVTLDNVSKESRQRATKKVSDVTTKFNFNGIANRKSDTRKHLSSKGINSPQTMSKRDLDLSTKESGYNTAVNSVKQDSTIFKKPTKPVRRKTTEKSSEKTSTSVLSRKPITKGAQKPTTLTRVEDNNLPVSQPSKSLPLSGNSSRRFFKANTNANANKQANLPLKKPKRLSRKRIPNTTKTGISPKRKQVNTVKPLNHLTKPDCDPEEAALEYVENGGYANIISFLRSNLGATCFSEEQRQQIIENVEKINEDLERCSHRFIQKDASSDTDGDSIWKPTLKQRKGNAAQRVAQVANFVPYSMWKMKQKEKTTVQSTMLSSKPEQQNQQPATATATLNVFDQLKVSSPDSNGASSSKPNTSQRKTDVNETVVADNKSCSSSASSYSNHNFHITESDNELGGTHSDEEILDMVCRRGPEQMNQSPVPVPIELSHIIARRRSSSSSQASLGLSDCDVIKPSQSQIDSEPKLIHKTKAKTRSPYQMSEIYEDLDEIPTGDASQDVANSKSISNSASERTEIQSIHSSTTTIRRDIHTESERNQKTNSTWYVDKYLRDQKLHVPTPFNSNVSSNCFDSTSEIIQDEHSALPRPQNVTNNQVIIQNQIVLSTARKRNLSNDYEDSPLAKIHSGRDRTPLRGYAQLLPSYMERVTREKDRLLQELEGNLQKDLFENFNEIADEVMKSMAEHETAINDAQEQLSFIFGKLEWLIENQQKNKSQLESIYCQLIGRIRASLPRKEEVDKAYEEVAERLKNHATTAATELWQTFANGVVNSVADRMKDLIHF